MPPLRFGGQDFTVVGGAALHWPKRNALIVADLHLEKGSWFAQRGQMLPPYDSRATLDRLGVLIADTGAREIWCLGDNFHDNAGAMRLPTDARDSLASLTGATQWIWITGNHDEHLPNSVGGTIVDEAVVDGLILRHYANAADRRPELSGHFHPKYRVLARGRAVSRACFVRSKTKLILPAFGALTGGMAADHPAIIAAVGKGATALIPARDQLLSFPLS